MGGRSVPGRAIGEAYLVQPLVQRWAVRLPPVLSILAVLIFGLLFGLPGALLAAPLMVLSMTLVEHLYVRAVAGAALGQCRGTAPRPAAGGDPGLR
jgi:predicted PurR-regulated permease PerM